MADINILGVHVDVTDKGELQKSVLASSRLQRKDVYAYVNVHAVNLAQRDANFRNFLNDALSAYCDGEGVRLGARLLGRFLPPRIVLTYWIWDLCRFFEENDLSVFFLGGKEDVVERAVKVVTLRHPRLNVKGWHHGYFTKEGPENDRVVEMISGAAPNVLFVGFGMPLQEHWIQQNLSRLTVNAVFPAGSMIDYTAGVKKYAPRWMTSHGLEWLHRFLMDPWRLWRRYLIGNPLFVLRVVRQRLTQGLER